jgi:hypothetical protein
MGLDIAQVMLYVSKKINKKFTYQGKEYPTERLFALDGILPVLARKASTLSDFLFNKGLDINYVDAPDGLTGEALKVSDRENAFIVIMLLYDSLEEIIASQNKDIIDIS